MKKFAFQLVFFFFFLIAATFQLRAQSITGYWEGSLSVAGNEIKLFFNIEQENEDLHATLDVPDQGARGIPVESTELQNDSLFLRLPALGASFKGKYKPAEQELAGEWTQHGTQLPLLLKRSEGIKLPSRPQTPQAPFPYYSEEVTFENKQAGISLSGTFTRPKEAGQHPAVILLSGSGPQDRDGTLLDHKPLLVLAGYLSRNGFAVLRYDDRGFGRSGGNFISATTEDFALDAAAAFDYLQNRPDVNAREIGFIGMSEGGIIAPMVANEKPTAFLVLLAPPVLPGKDLLLLQGERILQKGGAPEWQVQEYKERQAQILDVVRLEQDPTKAAQKLEELLQPRTDSLSGKEKQPDKLPSSYISGQIAQLLSPWYRYYAAYDPASSFAKVNAPVLALFGSKDLQVPAPENVEALRKITTRSQKENFNIEVMNGLNHLFQPATTGLPGEYNQIETTIAPEVLLKIKNWLGEQLSSPSK